RRRRIAEDLEIGLARAAGDEAAAADYIGEVAELVGPHLQGRDVEVGIFGFSPLRHQVRDLGDEGAERAPAVVVRGDEDQVATRAAVLEDAVAGGEDDRPARRAERCPRTRVRAFARVKAE